MYKEMEEIMLFPGGESEAEYIVKGDDQGLTVGDLIEELQKLPKDAKVKVPHFYRRGEAVRTKDHNVMGITPCFNIDTNKLMYFLLGIDIKYNEV